MKNNKKIQAFTINEMVVVLILSSIVVGLAFSVLSLVQKHMYGIQNNFAKNTELNKLEQSFWLDFNRYSDIKYNELEDKLTFATAIDSISYQFHKTFIIKNLDTFNIETQSKMLFFDGNEINQGFVDALKLETSKTLQSQQLFIFKDNDATHYLN
ncbi:PulJ/GspJ family protein [Flavivirga jejuensis]|uniref:Prepilin-type N-terminal cleavage/methylation domain-containing protein n=1 Tax=Flavivirga jejuensis TaxID=870487 RepID=A0ABT8WMY7_9FLAO|nr:hypothetical protein [Flavivirga jejuensis]MDO5974525.1 hypothetical protein [Flavivirga jejuensis]